MEDSSPDPRSSRSRPSSASGRWRPASPDGPPWPGEARVAFEWLEGRRFLIQRWSIDLPEAPNGIAIIGLRDAPASAEAVAEAVADSDAPYRQHYFDSARRPPHLRDDPERRCGSCGATHSTRSRSGSRAASARTARR